MRPTCGGPSALTRRSPPLLPYDYFMPPQALMWHNMAMVRLWLQGGLAGGLMLVLAGSAFAAPRLERERCTFKPPRGDRVECFTLIVPDNPEQPAVRQVRVNEARL